MIEFVKLYEAENEEDKETYFQEVIAGLSKDEKDTPDRFIYDKIGSEQFSRINFL